MDKMHTRDAKKILLTSFESLSCKGQPAVKEAYDMASKALDVIELMPTYKRNFPQSAVLDDILDTLRKMGFDMPEFKTKGVY